MNICPVCNEPHFKNTSDDNQGKLCNEHLEYKQKGLLAIVEVNNPEVIDTGMIPSNTGRIAYVNAPTYKKHLGTEEEYTKGMETGVIYTNIESFEVILQKAESPNNIASKFGMVTSLEEIQEVKESKENSMKIRITLEMLTAIEKQHLDLEGFMELVRKTTSLRELLERLIEINKKEGNSDKTPQ